MNRLSMMMIIVLMVTAIMIVESAVNDYGYRDGGDDNHGGDGDDGDDGDNYICSMYSASIHQRPSGTLGDGIAEPFYPAAEQAVSPTAAGSIDCSTSVGIISSAPVVALRSAAARKNHGSVHCKPPECVDVMRAAG